MYLSGCKIKSTMSEAQAKMQKMEAILKKSLITIKKLEAEVAANKSNKEPIAIVGMGMRLPGGIQTIDGLWELLAAKGDKITEIPKERWDADAIYSTDSLENGKSCSKHGAFLTEDISAFDANFFGISPREAKSIDPIQRMLLEVTQETLEQAGIAPDDLKGSKTGVFLGIGASDYAQARLRSGNLEDIDVYDATGIPFATASGRISYLFDLQGPSIALDAACSSATASLHLGVESLRKKESNLVIAGAANLILTPELYIALTKLNSLSTDATCRPFDENGNGYVRGEGCGVVLLKRLSDAEKDGDNILAVIKGSAVKHNGKSNGFTAPNPEVQAEVIQEALKDAQVDASTIDFVEAHGLGNRFTDALEVQAIQSAYGKRNKPIYIGSLKPNVGHLEAAIGMAMLGKVIASFQAEKIAPNINFETPNKDVDWTNIKVQVPTEVIDWQAAEGQPLRAAINLSGYSGTNTHLILEAPPKKAAQASTHTQAHNFHLSAKSAEALDTAVDNYIQFLEQNADVPIADVLFTQAVGRSNYDHKLTASVESSAQLLEALQAYKTEGKHKLISKNDIEVARNRDVAMLFTGQGAQYHNMCKSLYEESAVFKKAVDDCNALLQPHMDRPIIEVLYGDDDQIINQTQYTQPALFVVEYALAQLWKSYGVEPSAVAGHSVGEFVALTIAGVVSLEDALKLIAKRGALMQSLPEGQGGMAAILASVQDVESYLEAYEDVDIAAINSPGALTVSGSKESINALVAVLKNDKIKAVNLVVSHAFHSYMMEPILKEFEALAATVQFNVPEIPVISNVTGKELEFSDLTPQYFSKHIRGTVRFYEDVKYLEETLGIDIFLEAGPNPTLTGLAKKSVEKPTALFLSSGKKKQSDWKMLGASLKELYLADAKVDWKAVFANTNGNKIALPTYPWQHKSYWYNPVKGMPTSATATNETAEATIPAATTTANGSAMVINSENLINVMQKEAVAILGLEKGSKLDIYKSIREQGFDSMMSGEFLARLEKVLGIKLEMSLIHVYSDMNSLHDYILKDVIGDNENTISMEQVMFDTNNGPILEEDESENWHDIKPDDGVLMRWFKKFDKALGVSD